MNNSRAEAFLKYLRDILVYNPGYDFSIDNIYGALINLGVESTQNQYIDNLFGKWINHFENLKNIDVFVDDNWKYFCQFVNRDREAMRYNTHLKLYVPLDAAHIEVGAKMLFEFLRDNNIIHHSKIGRVIRFDDIVIRLVNENDLNKVLDFVKNNKYLQEGLIPANPFAFNKDGLAMVSDGRLSYNLVITNYIKMYFVEKQKENNLNDISFDDFYSFVLNYYNNNMVSKDENKLFNDFENHFDEYYDDRVTNDVISITELFLKSMDKKFGFDDYLEHYNNCLDPRVREVSSKENNSVYFEKMMSFIINVMIERFSSYDVAREYIVNYFATGYYKNLTRNSDLRQIIVSSGYREKLLSFLNNIDVSYEDYIDYVYNKNVSLNISDNNDKYYSRGNSNYDNISCSKEDFLINALINTAQEHSKSQAVGALRELIYSHNYDYFTRKNNARFDLNRNVSVKDVVSIVKNSLGYDEDYLYLNASDLELYYDSISQSKKR